MAEFYKKNEKERKKANEWLNQFRPNYESTLYRIDKYQERKLLNIQTIVLVLIGAFFVSLLSASIFDLLLSLTTSLVTARLLLDVIAALISTILILVIFLFFKKQLLKYQPQTPILTLLVKPEDIEPFIDAKRFALIMQFLDDAKLQNFKEFAKGFFESFKIHFSYVLGNTVDKVIKEYEEKSEDPIHENLVAIAKDFDLSTLSTTGVKVTLQVKLSPRVVFSLTQQGDKTASYSFYLAFHLIVLNPEHCDAGKWVEQFYISTASEMVISASYAIDSAFKKNGLPYTKDQFYGTTKESRA